MIDATFNIPSDVISNQTFNGTLVFASDVTLFDAADIHLTGIDGNGIQGVTFTITESMPDTYLINFTLPTDAEGVFSVEATGTVLPAGETIEQAINATPASPTVTYDTSVAVSATWGTPDYSVGEAQVALPITFAADVVISSPSIFSFTPVAPLTDADFVGKGFDATINGDGTDWILTITLPLDIQGSIEIDAVGEVFKESTMVYDTVTIAALTVTVPLCESRGENALK